MFKKLIERLKATSRRTKCLVIEVFIIAGIVTAAVGTACCSETAHIVREEAAKGCAAGLCLGLLLALHRLAMGMA